MARGGVAAAFVYEVDGVLDELAFPGTTAAVREIWGWAGSENREAGAGRIGDPERRPGKGNGSIERGNGGGAVAVVRWGEVGG